MREIKFLGGSKEAGRLAVKPKIIGKGAPRNIPFLSGILNASKHPNGTLRWKLHMKQGRS